MSANKFKVGDKVRVRKNLVKGRQYGRIYYNADMAALGLSGKTFTISGVDISAYRLENYGFWWSDEMLEPAEKTLDNLCRGDMIRDSHGDTRKILAALDGCYLLNYGGSEDATGDWYTVAELKKLDYQVFDPNSLKATIEINGKNYKKADIEEAIKDLEAID
ncbi:MAG: hypothetical protein HXL05_00905 [Candidatus Nanosynbacter sp.]|nr:hypothetical protein [Candidatus Nanosynbacter sp.]